MKRTAAWLILPALIGLFSGCGKTEVTPPELLEPAGIQVDTATVRYGDIYNAAVYDAQIMPYVEEAAFSVSGSLGEVLVMVGDTVEKGQLLATLDNESIRSRIEALDDQITEIKKAGSYLDRQLELDIEIAQKELLLLEEAVIPEESIPEASVPEESAPEEAAPEISEAEASAAEDAAKEVDAARKVKQIEIEQLQAKLAQQKELRQAELSYLSSQRSELEASLNNAELTAPISGRIVYIDSLKPGTSIKSYTTFICIADETRRYIRSEYISDTAITQAEQVYAKIMDQEYALTYVPTDYSEYLSVVLSGGSAYTVFTSQQGFGEAKSGQYAAVMLVDSYKSNTLVVPVNALFEDENGSYVYIMEDDTRKRQDVTVGLQSDAKAEILEGLQEGDTVYVKE